MGGDDLFDEMQVIEEIGRRLVALSYEEEVVREQLGRLQVFDGSVRKGVRHYSWTMLDVTPDQKPPEPSMPPPGEFPDFLPRVVGYLDSDSEVELGIEAQVVPKGHYVVSIIGRSMRRTLHRMGECYRVPGQRHKEFEVMGPDLPEPAEFHKACKACFASRGGVGQPVAAPRADSSGSDSEESSSDQMSGESDL